MRITRRKLITWSFGSAVAAPLVALSYCYLETGWLEVTHTVVGVPRLPAPFAGLRVAVLTDIHHGPMTPLSFVRKVVDRTLALQPDVIALVGDFVEGRTGQDFFIPCFAELARLTAPLGVFSVPGNHDYWEKIVRYRAALATTAIQDLTNRGVWLQREGARLRLGGVDDLWCGQPNIAAALADTRDDEAALLLCHNPDYIETMTDHRVGLAISGHMHGAQVRLPYVTRHIPSRYGTKYLMGLVNGPAAQVYVSRGIGTVSVPFRFRSRPEVAVLELWPA